MGKKSVIKNTNTQNPPEKHTLVEWYKNFKKTNFYIIGIVAIFILSAYLTFHNTITTVISDISSARATDIKRTEEDSKISKIHIGIYQKYINDLFGTPYVRSKAFKGLTTEYYYLDGCIMNCYYSEDTLVAFFITLTNKDRKVNINMSQKSNGKTDKLGEIKYNQPYYLRAIGWEYPPAYCYYEIYSDGFVYPILASLWFGVNDDIDDIFFIGDKYSNVGSTSDNYQYHLMIAENQNVEVLAKNKEFIKFQQEITPNTFGIASMTINMNNSYIQMSYKDWIYCIIQSDAYNLYEHLPDE